MDAAVAMDRQCGKHAAVPEGDDDAVPRDAGLEGFGADAALATGPDGLWGAISNRRVLAASLMAFSSCIPPQCLTSGINTSTVGLRINGLNPSTENTLSADAVGMET